MSDPFPQDGRMNADVRQDLRQLGLELGRAARPPRRPRRPCNRERAEWWFQQMRRAIGDAGGTAAAGAPGKAGHGD